MARTRISTTVSAQRLADARSIASWRNDAEMMDEALAALVRQHRAATIDRAYRDGYGAAPIDTPDEWGDLESFHQAASRT